MNRFQQLVRVVAGVLALGVASGFVNLYSHYVDLRLRLASDPSPLPNACVTLLDSSLLIWLLPAAMGIVGVATLIARSESGVVLLNQSCWLLAFILVCFTIVVWEIALIPIPRPLL